jgi:cell division protein FtsB
MPQVPELTGVQVSDSAWVEANCSTLADVAALYRELREARAKLAALETMARDLNKNSSHSDYGDGRWEVARRILDIVLDDGDAARGGVATPRPGR